MEDKVKHIRSLISNSNLNEAFNKLEPLCSLELEDLLFALKSRFKDSTEDYIKGIIERNKFKQEKAEITASLLDLTSELLSDLRIQ